MQGVGLSEARPPLQGEPTEPHPGLFSHRPEGRHPLGLHPELSGTETNLPLAQRAILMHLIQMLERGCLSFLVGFLLEDFEQSHLGFFSAFISPSSRGFPYPTFSFSFSQPRLENIPL